MNANGVLTCNNEASPRGAGNTAEGSDPPIRSRRRRAGVSLPMQEQWRPIPGYEGCYEASDLGRVRTLPRTVMRTSRWGGQAPFRIPGRIRRQSADARTGRPIVSLKRGGISKTYQVHALVLSAFAGPRPLGMEACHNDGNPLNNRADNLRWDTHSENMYDKQRHGTDHKRNITHCPRDHILAAPNLEPTIAARGHRNCYACALARKAMWKAKKRGVTDFDMKAASDARYARIMQTKENAA